MAHLRKSHEHDSTNGAVPGERSDKDASEQEILIAGAIPIAAAILVTDFLHRAQLRNMLIIIMAAALGLAQLSRAQELLAARRSLAAGYAARFERSPIGDLIELPEDAPDDSHAWHLFVIRLHLDRLTIDRAAVMDGLRELGIGASVHFIPLHRHPYYRGRPETTPRALPNAEREFWRVISLPIWPGMTDVDLDRVVAGLESILGPTRR